MSQGTPTKAPNGDRLRHREHYLRASLAGGGLAALLSIFPLTSWLNWLFGSLIIAGGGFAVWVVQRKSSVRIESVEAMVIGALSGLVCGLFLFAVVLVIGGPLWVIAYDGASRYQEDEVLVLGTVMFLGSCGAGVTVYPVLAGLGGLLGGLMFKPAQSAEPGPDGEPVEKAPPTPEDLLRRKKRNQMILAGCGGCFALMMACCGGSGYLLYLQSRDPSDTAGYDEVASAPVVLGQVGRLTIPPSESSRGRYAVWLVNPDGYASYVDVDAELGCSPDHLLDSDGMARMRNPYPDYHGDDSEPTWLYLTSEYHWSGRPMVCNFRVDEPSSLQGARIVVVQLTRPTDWLD